MVEPENRETDCSCSNGMTFSGSREDLFSLKTLGIGVPRAELPGGWSNQRIDRLTSLIWSVSEKSSHPAAVFRASNPPQNGAAPRP